MINNSKSIVSILNNRVCIGCGACTIVCPSGSLCIKMSERYNYPYFINDDCLNCSKCLNVCPSKYLLDDVILDYNGIGLDSSYKYCLIHALDDDIRVNAASGGFATGFMIYMLENNIIDGAIVCKTNSSNPLTTDSFIARDRNELLEATASRYTPTSSCLPLKEIIKNKGRYAFVGKPCEIIALKKLYEFIPGLKESIFCTISPFCAGTPARSSTKQYLKRFSIDLEKIKKICYRGNGWPGTFRVYDDNGLMLERNYIGDELKYLVGSDCYLRCNLCSDKFGAYADISISDPWSKEYLKNENKGRTAIVIRNKELLSIINNAIKDGCLCADNINKEDIIGFQKGLISSLNRIETWYFSYSLIFLHKIQYLSSFIKYNGEGIKTCIKAYLNNNYYEKR